MDKLKNRKILVILGPTASGKSGLGVKLAKRFKGEIISTDSRQVYKGLNAGTGKITKLEMSDVPHHLIDVADPKKQFSVSDYKKLAEEKIEGIKNPIIVGGTGFYIDILTGVANFPDVPPNKKLRERLSKKSNETLFKLLKRKDPKRAKNIDMNNKVRLIRALEIVEALGKVPTIKPKPLNNFKFIGLRPNDLDKRILERLEKRFESMILEGKKLYKQGLSYKRMKELGLEYRYLALYLQEKLSKEEMFEKLNNAIRRYAKRQMTWFKRNKKIKWFKPEEYKAIESYARITLKGD